MVSKKRNRTKNGGKNRTKKYRTMNNTRKIVDRSRKRRKTIRGGVNQKEYVHVEFFKKKTGPNVGRIIRVVQDPIFGTNTNDIADMSYLFGKRMGEVDEVIEIMKNGRKEKPYKRILYRLSFNDKHGPMMSYSGKQIKQCGGPATAAATSATSAANAATTSAAATSAAVAGSGATATDLPFLTNFNVVPNTKSVKMKEPDSDATVRKSLNRFLTPFGIQNSAITSDLIRTTDMVNAIDDINSNKTIPIKYKSQFTQNYKQFSESQDKSAQELNGIMGCMIEAITNIITKGNYQPAKRALFEFIYKQAIAPKMAVLYTKSTSRTDHLIFKPLDFRIFLSTGRRKSDGGCT